AHNDLYGDPTPKRQPHAFRSPLEARRCRRTLETVVPGRDRDRHSRILLRALNPERAVLVAAHGPVRATAHWFVLDLRVRDRVPSVIHYGSSDGLDIRLGPDCDFEEALPLAFSDLQRRRHDELARTVNLDGELAGRQGIAEPERPIGTGRVVVA